VAKHKEKLVEETPIEFAVTAPVATVEAPVVEALPAEVAVSEEPGPMAALNEAVAAGKSQAVAIVEIVQELLLSCHAPADQVEQFGQLIAGAFKSAAVVVNSKACEPYYKVQAVTPHGGFWRIGRKFSSTPTNVLVKDLSPEQIKALTQTSPKVLSVVLVTTEQ
jgi:hypothetical protein